MNKTALIGILLGACGGDASSGVDGSKKLIDLTADEQMKECVYSVDVEGGPGHQTMCGDATIETHTLQECIDGLKALAMTGTCQVTVAQAEACAEAVGSNPCSLGGSACAPLTDSSCSTPP